MRLSISDQEQQLGLISYRLSTIARTDFQLTSVEY